MVLRPVHPAVYLTIFHLLAGCGAVTYDICSNDASPISLLADTTAFLQSPNYPGEYPRDLACTSTFHAPAAMRIKIRVMFLDTYDNDYVALSERTDETSTVSPTTTSTASAPPTGPNEGVSGGPQMVGFRVSYAKRFVIWSTAANTLRVRLISKNVTSGEGSGFSLELKVLDCGDPSEVLGGNRTFGEFPYGNMVTFSCQPGQAVIDGCWQRECKKNGWSGREPDKCTDALHEACVGDSTVHLRHGEPVVFQSPSFPDNSFPPDCQCEHTFIAPEDTRIRVGDITVWLGRGYGSWEDHIELYDSASADTEASFCRQDDTDSCRTNFKWGTTGNALTAVFVTNSDSSDNQQGFKMTLEVVEECWEDPGNITDGTRYRQPFPNSLTMRYECPPMYVNLGSRRRTCDNGSWTGQPPERCLLGVGMFSDQADCWDPSYLAEDYIEELLDRNVSSCFNVTASNAERMIHFVIKNDLRLRMNHIVVTGSAFTCGALGGVRAYHLLEDTSWRRCAGKLLSDQSGDGLITCAYKCDENVVSKFFVVAVEKQPSDQQFCEIYVV